MPANACVSHGRRRPGVGVIELDGFDRRLLALLQENSRRTGAELAELVGLSAAACLRRLQRLRESGVIAREVALLAPEYRERRITTFVLLTFERDRPNRERQFVERMRALPEVAQCYHVTGSADFLLAVATADMDGYHRFTEKHFYEPYVKRFESYVVLSDALKTGAASTAPT